jgi:hypothetical protein
MIAHVLVAYRPMSQQSEQKCSESTLLHGDLIRCCAVPFELSGGYVAESRGHVFPRDWV